jgi:hypothetical protein
MELFPEFFTVDVEDELPESFTLPPVAVADPPAPPAPPVAVTTLLFVLLPPVAVDVEVDAPPVAEDEEPEVFVFVFLFLLLLVLLFELLGSCVGGFSHSNVIPCTVTT